MKLYVNGSEKEVKASTVLELLNEFELEKEKVVVELNKEIVDKEKFDETTLKENDSLEIVTLVGGG